MKVCVIQPPYSLQYADSEKNFLWELDALDRCDSSMDLIALPEYSNVPAYAKTKAQMLVSYETYTKPLLDKAMQTAKRCDAVVFLSCIFPTDTGLRNTTVAISRDGSIAGKYYKQHLVPSEMYTYELDKEYTFDSGEPTVIEIDGVRYGFLICYDAYFYEAFANIARRDPDVIVACSHQRSDSHDALRTMHKFLAYNTNAYVVRSSVSMGENAGVGGTSMVITPEGMILADMEGRVGMTCAEIDPHKRYLKPAGFGNPPDCHHHYVEAGRRPWKYRPGGSAICRYDDWMPYPRVCAHRGLPMVLPENTMPALGAAVAMGAPEIEFDLWQTSDGVVVSCHDAELEKVSNGTGRIWEHTYQQLCTLDFGSKMDSRFAGLQICTFEQILQKFAGHAVMNIHIKDIDETAPLPENYVAELVRLIDKYDCRRHCYFMNGKPVVLQQLRQAAPDITRCACAGYDLSYDLVQKALDCGCKKIQLNRYNFPKLPAGYLEDVCRRAHEAGLRVNLFWCDDSQEAREFIAKGVDTILTNDYLAVAQAIEQM